MKRSKRSVVVILVAALWLVGKPVVVEAKANNPIHLNNSVAGQVSNGESNNDIEEQILSSTVRLEWHVQTRNDDGSGYTEVGSVGHATVKAGRYLVTHNHTHIVSLSDRKDGEIVQLSVSTAGGELIWEGPLAAISVALEDPETLVLDFGTYRGQGFLTTIGLPSAEFKAWESLSLLPGMEVAQIDWDGATAHVEWVAIEDVVTHSGTPRLELANVVMRGASGGGVFWNGYHIGNNWSQATTYDANSGAVTRQYSVVALNSNSVVAAASATADELTVSSMMAALVCYRKGCGSRQRSWVDAWTLGLPVRPFVRGMWESVGESISICPSGTQVTADCPDCAGRGNTDGVAYVPIGVGGRGVLESVIRYKPASKAGILQRGGNGGCLGADRNC
jgi:hypothetical protein